MSFNIQQDTVNMICQMFNNQVDEKTALELLMKNNGNVENTIDALLNITLQKEATNTEVTQVEVQTTVEEKEEEKKPLLDEFTVIPAASQPDTQEKPTQTEESSKTLEQQLAEAVQAKEKVEEEKKKAMKWCLDEMNALREQIKQKDDLIAQQQKEIETLREQVENTKGKKVEKYFKDTKAAFVEGFNNLSDQINTNIAKVQKDLKDESAIFEKLKEFVAEIKLEIMELFKPTKKISPPSTTTTTTTTTDVPINVNEQEEAIKNLKEKDPELFEATRASLTTAVEDLESDLKFVDDLNKATKASMEENNATPTTPPQPAQPVSSPVVSPPVTPVPNVAPTINAQPYPGQQPYYNVYPQTYPYPPQNFAGYYPYYPPPQYPRRQ